MSHLPADGAPAGLESERERDNLPEHSAPFADEIFERAQVAAVVVESPVTSSSVVDSRPVAPVPATLARQASEPVNPRIEIDRTAEYSRRHGVGTDTRESVIIRPVQTEALPRTIAITPVQTEALPRTVTNQQLVLLPVTEAGPSMVSAGTRLSDLLQQTPPAGDKLINKTPLVVNASVLDDGMFEKKLLVNAAAGEAVHLEPGRGFDPTKTKIELTPVDPARPRNEQAAADSPRFADMKINSAGPSTVPSEPRSTELRFSDPRLVVETRPNVSMFEPRINAPLQPGPPTLPQTLPQTTMMMKTESGFNPIRANGNEESVLHAMVAEPKVGFAPPNKLDRTENTPAPIAFAINRKEAFEPDRPGVMLAEMGSANSVYPKREITSERRDGFAGMAGGAEPPLRDLRDIGANKKFDASDAYLSSRPISDGSYAKSSVLGLAEKFNNPASAIDRSLIVSTPGDRIVERALLTTERNSPVPPIDKVALASNAINASPPTERTVLTSAINAVPTDRAQLGGERMVPVSERLALTDRAPAVVPNHDARLQTASTTYSTIPGAVAVERAPLIKTSLTAPDAPLVTSLAKLQAAEAAARAKTDMPPSSLVSRPAVTGTGTGTGTERILPAPLKVLTAQELAATAAANAQPIRSERVPPVLAPVALPQQLSDRLANLVGDRNPGKLPATLPVALDTAALTAAIRSLPLPADRLSATLGNTGLVTRGESATAAAATFKVSTAIDLSAVVTAATLKASDRTIILATAANQSALVSGDRSTSVAIGLNAAAAAATAGERGVRVVTAPVTAGDKVVTAVTAGDRATLVPTTSGERGHGNNLVTNSDRVIKAIDLGGDRSVVNASHTGSRLPSGIRDLGTNTGRETLPTDKLPTQIGLSGDKMLTIGNKLIAMKPLHQISENDKRYLTGIELIAGIVALTAVARARAEEGREGGKENEGETEGSDEELVSAQSEPDYDPKTLVRPKHMVQPGDTLATIAEEYYNDANLAWLLLLLNKGKLNETWKGEICYVEVNGRQELDLPVREDIVHFYQALSHKFESKRVVTTVRQSQIDQELVTLAFHNVVGRRRLQSAGSH